MPPYTYGFSAWYTASIPCGFPHSDIPGSTLAYSSPRHIVVRHVLHRLLAPRHPPYALSNLSIRSLCWYSVPMICSITGPADQISQLKKSLHTNHNFALRSGSGNSTSRSDPETLTSIGCFGSRFAIQFSRNNLTSEALAYRRINILAWFRAASNNKRLPIQPAFAKFEGLRLQN
jgi:hypothetical protein